MSAEVGNVKLPNGYVVKNVPSNIGRDELKKAAITNGWAQESDFPAVVAQPPAVPDTKVEGVATAPAVAPNDIKKESERNYILDQASRGIWDMASNLVPDFIKMGESDIDFKSFQNADGTFRVQELEQVMREKEDAQAAAWVGYEGVAPDSTTEQIAGAAARSLTSEGPLAIAGASKKATSVIGEAAYSAAAATIGALAQEGTSQIGQKWGLPSYATEMLSAITGSMANVGLGATRSLTQTAFETAGTTLNKRKEMTSNVDKASDYLASAEMKQVIGKATEAQPNIDSVIQAAQDLESQIPGLIIPPAAALADNPIYRKNTEHLLRSDPEFFASAKKALQDANAAVTARKEQLFGKADQLVDAKIRASLPKNYTGRIKAAEKRKELIQAKIDTLTDKVKTPSDQVDIGESVRGLMNAKVESVRKVLSPQYERLLKNAEKTDVAMSSKGVAEVHKVVKLMKYGDNFAAFPSLINKINTEWSPVDATASPVILNSRGVPLRQPKGDVSYPEVSSVEVDSLKRAVNKAYRESKDPNQQRMLGNVKQVLAAQIQQAMPESFARPYADLDAQFYRELGIPFSKAGLSQLDAARFSTQQGAYLAKPEQARDFLSFVGESGVPVVRAAILTNLEKQAFNKDGSLDVNNVTRFINRNNRIINEVPGLRAELQDVGQAVRNLGEESARLDADYSRRSKELTDGFYKAMHGKKLEGVVNDILNSPEKSSQYLRDIKNMTPETAKMVRQGLRAGILENGIARNNESMIQFISRNKNVMDSWFGSTYANDVRNIAAAGDMINKLDTNTMRFATDYRDKDALSDKVGISSTQLQSILRDRITGVGTKLAIIGSKVNTSKTANKRDSQMMELLLNTDALATIRKSVEDTRITITAPQLALDFANNINKAISKGVYFGISGQEAMEQQPEIAPRR